MTLHGGGEWGAIVMLPHDVRELPYAPFWGFNAAHRCTELFLLCGTAFARARREPWGWGEMGGAIVMLPHDVRELPYAPFWGFNAAHRCSVLFLLCGTAFAQARAVGMREGSGEL